MIDSGFAHTVWSKIRNGYSSTDGAKKSKLKLELVINRVRDQKIIFKTSKVSFSISYPESPSKITYLPDIDYVTLGFEQFGSRQSGQ